MMTSVYGERAVVAVKGIRLFKKVFGNDAVNVLNVQFKNKKKERKTIKQIAIKDIFAVYQFKHLQKHQINNSPKHYSKLFLERK
jgi:hypothetical protein